MVLATVIDGKQAAASVIEAVKAAAARLEEEAGVKTGLAVVIVGDDPASHTYVGAKGRMQGTPQAEQDAELARSISNFALQFP